MKKDSSIDCVCVCVCVMQSLGLLTCSASPTHIFVWVQSFCYHLSPFLSLHLPLFLTVITPLAISKSTACERPCFGENGERGDTSRPREGFPNAMATLSDLKEVKEALDAGLVSQAEYDAVKRDYLRVKKDALEAEKEFQKRELIAKEAFQKRELIAQRRRR